MKNNRSILASVLSVSGIVVFAKLLGFIKQTIMASAFGATIHTDIINLSQGVVQDVDYLLIQALLTAFVPIYLSVKSDSEEEAKIFTSHTIIAILMTSVIVSLLLIVLAGPIASILAPSYSDELHLMLAKYVRINSPVMIFIVLLAVYNALLKANEKFIPGELIHVNQSIIYIVLILTIGSFFGPDTLIVSFYTYAICNLIYLVICSRKHLGGHIGNPIHDNNLKKLFKMMGPIIVGYAMVFVNQQVDKIIVSGLGEGTVTAMTYASVLSTFVLNFVGTICGVLFTYVTKSITERNDENAAKITVSSITQIATLLIPLCIITVFNAHDIVTIVFGRGQFDNTAIDNCSLALIGYSIAFVPFVFREMFSRVQYGYGDSKTPMINSIISIVINIILSITLSRHFGVLGVTVASSIAVIVCAVLNIRSSVKINRHIYIRSLFSYGHLWMIGLVICIAISVGGQYLLDQFNTILRFAVVASVTLMVYVLVTFPIIKPLLQRMLNRH